MRRSKASAEEILKAEKAKDDRQRSRKNGYSMMNERDQGFSRLRDHQSNEEVVMVWPVDRDLEEGEALTRVPEGYFLLVAGGKTMAFDTEEFRRSLRWA